MRGAKKSEYNPCPVCGKPRGVGPHEFSHGRCAEVMAKTHGKEIVGVYPSGKPITKEQKEKAEHRRTQKNYLKGKLPDWMYS